MQNPTRTREAEIYVTAAGGHALRWTDETRPTWERDTETVTDRQAETIARALDPFTIEGSDEYTRQAVAREILTGAAYHGLTIYREWVELGDTEDEKLAREILETGAEHAG